MRFFLLAEWKITVNTGAMTFQSDIKRTGESNANAAMLTRKP